MTVRRYEIQFRPAAVRPAAQTPKGHSATPADRHRDPALISPPGSVKLAGSNDLWRIRVGDFRVVYTITDEALVITVVRVANRREVYRGV